MSKFGSFCAYPHSSLTTAESALLTVWPTLARYHEELVLVGGLAIHYLTRGTASGLPGAVTMDVDFGISQSASGGQYGTIVSDLGGLGFRREGERLVRAGRDFNLYIDFLTEDPPAATGARLVDDVLASVVPGLDRALESRRWVTVTGQDIFGVAQQCEIAVADIGPLLVLKLNVFGGPTGRRLPKDAYDILLAVTGFIDGPEAALAGFRAEANAGNPGYASALEALRNDFRTEGSDGPVRAAEFGAGNAVEKERIKQRLVTVAEMLLEG